ncbi:hypothetical protein [Paraburkholderia sp. J12]|uniref:hypothetical protein n=1 Tax=Paraburkholderia sp. J12 TaxID=2805432 RepID=UPI002ABD3325|nr:hypothetical protein [Paraburkholderia sp. J12]
MTLLQCREPAFRAGRRALDTASARRLRGVCSDPEGSRLASGSALPDAIYRIGRAFNPSRFLAVKLKWQAF